MLKTTDSLSGGRRHITRAARAIAAALRTREQRFRARHLDEARCRTAAAGCAGVGLQSSLKHRELDHTVFDLATRESGTSDPLELGTMLVKIAEGLVLRPKCRLESAHLANRTDR